MSNSGLSRLTGFNSTPIILSRHAQPITSTPSADVPNNYA